MYAILQLRLKGVHKTLSKSCFYHMWSLGKDTHPYNHFMAASITLAPMHLHFVNSILSGWLPTDTAHIAHLKQTQYALARVVMQLHSHFFEKNPHFTSNENCIFTHLCFRMSIL